MRFEWLFFNPFLLSFLAVFLFTSLLTSSSLYLCSIFAPCILPRLSPFLSHLSFPLFYLLSLSLLPILPLLSSLPPLFLFLPHSFLPLFFSPPFSSLLPPSSPPSFSLLPSSLPPFLFTPSFLSPSSSPLPPFFLLSFLPTSLHAFPLCFSHFLTSLSTLPSMKEKRKWLSENFKLSEKRCVVVCWCYYYTSTTVVAVCRR